MFGLRSQVGIQIGANRTEDFSKLRLLSERSHLHRNRVSQPREAIYNQPYCFFLRPAYARRSEGAGRMASRRGAGGAPFIFSLWLFDRTQYSSAPSSGDLIVADVDHQPVNDLRIEWAAVPVQRGSALGVSTETREDHLCSITNGASASADLREAHLD